MPLRNDPTLWFNLPGIVAAYQPVRAPDSLLARYNMRQGGSSAFRAEPGSAPAWASATGWTFGTTNYLTTGYLPKNTSSFVVRVANVSATGLRISVNGGDADCNVAIAHWVFSDAMQWTHRTNATRAPGFLNGVACLSGRVAYRNGVLDSSSVGSDFTATATTGCTLGVSANSLSGNLLVAAFFDRTLAPAEVWQASRQMAYCDVNPGWSVWAPRRKWYPYVLEAPVAGRVGVYGARPTVALPGGVRIVPQSEGGTNG